MNRRGFFRFLASAPAAAVVAPAAIAEVAPVVAAEMAKFSGLFGGRQVGKAAALAYGYGMRKYGTMLEPTWTPEPMQQAMSRMYRKPQVIKVLELDFAEIECKMMQYYKDDKDFTLKGLPGRKFRAIMDEVYEVEDEPEHIEGLA